jgi:hypothetical protein
LKKDRTLTALQPCATSKPGQPITGSFSLGFAEFPPHGASKNEKPTAFDLDQ